MADEGSPAVIPDDDGAAASAAATDPPPQQLLDVESSDVLRLIQHHLTECGLHGSARALREESGIGAAGVHRSGLLRAWARDGRWADVLQCLEGLDAGRCGLQVRTSCMMAVLVQQVVRYACSLHLSYFTYIYLPHTSPLPHYAPS